MNLKKFPFYSQLDRMDCGPTCLKMIAAYYGKYYTSYFLKKKANISKGGVSLEDIAEAAESIGFQTSALRTDYKTLEDDMILPCIVHWKQRHFIVVYAVTKKNIYVADPAHGLMKYTKDEFLLGWLNKKKMVTEKDNGFLLSLNPTERFYDNNFEREVKIGFNFLIEYFKPYKKYIIQLTISLFLGSILQLILPFLTQSVIDYGINYKDISFIYIILIAQLTLFVSQNTIELIRGWILLHITSRVNINLISDFLVKLIKLPIAFFDSKNTGDIIQRIYDHNRIQSFLSTTTLNTLFSTFNIIIFGYVLVYYNLQIFLVFLAGSITYIIWTILFLKKRAELDFKRFDHSSDNQNSLYQLIFGMQEIKLNGSEQRRRNEWKAVQIKIFKTSIVSLSLSQIQSIGGRFLNELKNIIITFLAAKAVVLGDITLGMMLSIQYIIGQLNLPITNLIGFIQLGQDAKLSLQRLSEIHTMEEEEDFDGVICHVPNNVDIKFENVYFKYGGKSSPLILKDLNFTIPAGKVTAIVGSSGSGKSTLVKLLLKFYNPLSGEIFIGMNELGNIKTTAWRKKCGSVMQDGFIFSDTIIRNITESDSDKMINLKKLEQAIEIANLSDLIENQVLGYNTEIGVRGINISGGQKQRILIARAIYKNPDFIFFDEATSSLDSNNEKMIMGNLLKFSKGKTVVIIAHRLSTVKTADQIIVLEKGQIIEKGTHSELIRNAGQYFTLVRNQLVLD